MLSYQQIPFEHGHGQIFYILPVNLLSISSTDSSKDEIQAKKKNWGGIFFTVLTFQPYVHSGKVKSRLCLLLFVSSGCVLSTTAVTWGSPAATLTY